VNLVATQSSVLSASTLVESHNLAIYVNGIFNLEQDGTLKQNAKMLLATLEKFYLKPAETLLISSSEIHFETG
jgi:phosphoglycolate phosphatase-like HAD superfamily hydrolase